MNIKDVCRKLNVPKSWILKILLQYEIAGVEKDTSGDLTFTDAAYKSIYDLIKIRQVQSDREGDL